MVNFKIAKLPDPRVTPEVTAKFINFGQLIEWVYTEKSGTTYRGLIFVGEKPHPQGFQTMADFLIETEGQEIPLQKAGEVSQIVMSEFRRQGLMTLGKHAQA
jgi:hypothetical protein